MTLGIFPVYADVARESEPWSTSFVCFDIDTRDLGPVYAITGALDPLPYVVEDTGGRGRHVWVFFSTPQYAGEVREWATAVVEAAGVKHVEIYPKQKLLPPGHLGNLIRLPFGVNRRTGERSRVLFGEFKTLDNVPTLAVPLKQEPRHGQEDGWLSAMWEGDSSPSGGRNNTLNRFHWWLLRRGFPQEVARELCERVNSGFHPPLDEAEFAKVVRERDV